tara:strand:- start:183 stop:599 length:417 start_codon:yes stop_codon:yes gene_type:complete
MIKFIILLPFIEIILFILFGDIFGFLNVIVSIFCTGSFGLWLILPKKNSKVDLKNLALEPVDWMFKRVSGILLFIPGFLTDLMGVLIFFKLLRTFIWSFLPKELINFSYNFNNQNNEKYKYKGDKIIDAEYRDLDDKK